MPILETERLLLRPWYTADLESYAQMMAVPEVVWFLGHDPLDRAEAWRSLALLVGHDVLRGFTLNAVVDKASDRGGPLRFIVSGRLARAGGRVGFHPDVWGRGFATEAAAAWRTYAFDTLGAYELISIVHELNFRSAAVAHRIGHCFMRKFQFRGQPCYLYGSNDPSEAVAGRCSARVGTRISTIVSITIVERGVLTDEARAGLVALAKGKGVVFSSARKGRVVSRPKDLPYREAGLLLRWHKSRWRCREQACPRGSFTESIDELPAGVRTTSRLRRAIADAVADTRCVRRAARSTSTTWSASGPRGKPARRLFPPGSALSWPTTR